jgi:TRAP transporter TAXI family solute receptor
MALNPTAVWSQINIASGLKSEVYNEFATDISNNTRVQTKIYPSQGSIENLHLLQTDSIQLAFIQYDVLYDFGQKAPSIKEKIKVFLPLYDEEIQIISLKRNNIKTVNDLIGKRVGVGGINSGTYFTAQSIKKMAIVDWTDSLLDFERSIPALLNNQIDAFFFVGAAPSNVVTSLSPEIQNQLQLVSIKLSGDNQCYVRRTIPKKTYPWQLDEVDTYTIKTVIVLNVNNLDAAKFLMMDSLYADLKYNLHGIQLNKYSHPKWKSVEFSDMENVDWPVFKEEYTMKEKVLDSIGWLAALLSFFQVYFIINKLWKRKHEQMVAESISISAMFISLLINSSFAIKNLSVEGYAQLSNNILWILASSTSFVIGIGFFVNTNKGASFIKLLFKALNLERREAGDLAKSLFQPTAADKILEILGRLAMIDNDLDEKEKKYIEHFASNWHLNIDWDEIEKYKDESGNHYNLLRQALRHYLSSSPSFEQASHLIDVINLLISADGVVSKEEALIQAELTGIIREYIGEADDIDLFRIAVVPQNKEQELAIHQRFSDLEKVQIAGGTAYLTESYYSEQYAEDVSQQYRALHVFSVVFKPKIIKDSDDLSNKIASETKED